MGIFSIFKKKPAQEDLEAEEPIEKLNYSELNPWIKKYSKKLGTEEEKAIDLIKQTITQYVKELKSRIAILQEVDVDEKKSQDSYKTIAKSGREQYIELLGQMFERFENLPKNNLKEFIERVNTIFLDFEKTSRKNYERATILIGKEMVAIKDTMKDFSKELLPIFQEKREIVTKQLNLEKALEKIDNFESNEKELENAIEETAMLEKRLTQKEGSIKDLKKELEELKKSRDYLENLSNKRKIETSEDDLKRSIMNLKQTIDFKALASFFHINPKQMEIVKECREDFYSCFMKDSGNSILKLLEESKLIQRNIREKFQEIKEQIKDLEATKKQITKDPTSAMQTQIENLEAEVEEIEREREKTLAREAKNEEEKQSLMNSLKASLKRVNVEIID